MSTAVTSRLVTFRVGTDLYAADIQSVERVLRYEVPRAIPQVPAWIEGVLQYAGRVVPVIDLRRRFNAASLDITGQTRMVVMSTADEWVAAIVDQVLDVRPVAAGDISPPPDLVRGLAGEYLRGVVRRDQQLVVVLNTDRLLSATESLALSALPLAAAPPAVADDDDPVPTDV
jgi:purine-binding chemotaxis protein CheW